MHAIGRATIITGLGAALVSLATLAQPTAAQEKPGDAGDRKPTVEAPASAGPAPEVGEVVLEDPLSGPGALWAEACSTNKNQRLFVGEGLLFKITGRCSETGAAAQITPQVTRLTVPDGEIRLETKVASGPSRAALRLWVRQQPNTSGNYYTVEIQPSVGRAALIKNVSEPSSTTAARPDQQAMLVSAKANVDTLAERADLAPMFVADGWNTIALRLQGPKIWLLINDQVALSAVDTAHTTGEVWLGVKRLGALDDTVESAMVLRNLRVSRLAQDEVGRRPIYLQPPGQGALISQNALTGSGLLTTGTCPTGRAATRFTADGYEMKLAGRCRDTETSASISTAPLKGFTLPDGEVRFDLKFTSGLDRAYFRLFFRENAAGDGYSVQLAPGRGWAYLYRWTNGESTYIAGREDLAWLFRPTDWNTVAVRVRGDQLWLLLNDQAVVFGSDGAYGTGAANFNLVRLDSPDDQQEVTVIVRNLQVSALAD